MCRVPSFDVIRILSHFCIFISSDFIRELIILSICYILQLIKNVKYLDLAHYFFNNSKNFQHKWTYLYTRTKRRFRGIIWLPLEVVMTHVAPSRFQNTKYIHIFQKLVVMNSHQNIGAIFEFYCKNEYIS